MSLPEPEETDSIECHLQQIGMGSLVCKAAKQTGEKTTNEVEPAICFNCHTGKVYRDIGCDAVLPKLEIRKSGYDLLFNPISMFCKIRKRETTLEYCSSCTIKPAETTKHIVSIVQNLFKENNFYSSYKNYEKARIAMRDGEFDSVITNSISFTESTIKIIHENFNKKIPDKETLTELYKSANVILKLEDVDREKAVFQVIGNLKGLVTSLANLRNSLSDAHGRGNSSSIANENIAELALNTSATISTFLIKRYLEVKGNIENV